MSDYTSKHIQCFNPSADGQSASRQKVYHYTSPQGLYAILKNKTMRFTDCQFLNDKSEYNHIREPLKTAFEETYYQIHDPSIGEVISYYISDNFQWDTLVNLNPGQGMKNSRFKEYSMRYFVFCATDLPDSLGMWNYYLRNGNYQGYNIHLSVDDFLNCFVSIKNPYVDVFYGKVIYDESEKVEILKEVIRKADQKLYYLRENSEYEEELDLATQEAQGDLLAYLEKYRLFFKDAAFSSEQEYRFVIRLPLEYENSENSVLKTGYEMKNGILVPFCELQINQAHTVSGITLSPMLENALAENGLRRFLKENGYGYNDRIILRQSIIPIRY